MKNRIRVPKKVGPRQTTDIKADGLKAIQDFTAWITHPAKPKHARFDLNSQPKASEGTVKQAQRAPSGTKAKPAD